MRGLFGGGENERCSGALRRCFAAKINNKRKYKIKLKLSFQKQQSSQLKFCAMMEVL